MSLLVPAFCARRSSAGERGGFALLVTIVLVALLVLILVGLASFTRVETRVAANSQDMAKARQNALFALNVALGELQRTTGPDQRSTVVADMGTVGDGEAATIDNGLPAANDGTYAWTAALGNTANPINQTDARKAGHTAEVPAVLNWLVSGNERVTFTASTTATNFGQITAVPPATPGAAGAIQFAPGAAITGLSATTTIATALQIKDTQNADRDAVLLVGPGSAVNSVDTNAPQANYVVAPLVEIKAPRGAVPGLAATDTPTIGRYAWWVGDEGVKARVNLVDPNAGQTTGAQARLRTMVAPRTGTEVVTGFDEATPGSDPTTDPIGRVLSNQQLAMLTGVTQEEAKARFHDVTPYSIGVLANTATGGLKKDLTAGLLASTQPNEIRDTEPLFTLPAATARTGGPNEAASVPYSSSDLTNLRAPAWSGTRPNRLPSWGSLRSYVRLQNDLDGLLPTIQPRPTSDTAMGIHPIMTRFQLFSYALAEGSGGGSPDLRAVYLPAAVLWNPYNVRLAAARYSVYYQLAPKWPYSNNNVMNNPWAGDATNTFSSTKWPVFLAVHGPEFNAADNAFNDVEDIPYRSQLAGISRTSNIVGEGGFRFVIDCPVLEPGEAMIFTPLVNTELSANGTSNVLVPGWRQTAFTEKLGLNVPGSRHIRYIAWMWPSEIAFYQRFSLGLGGGFGAAHSRISLNVGLI